jgi:hypothetical protein
MKAVTTVWLILLVVSFAVSVLALTSVQTRLIKKRGWRGLRHHNPVDVYWRNLSTLERALIWPGFIAFFLTLFAAALSAVFQSLTKS